MLMVDAQDRLSEKGDFLFDLLQNAVFWLRALFCFTRNLSKLYNFFGEEFKATLKWISFFLDAKIVRNSFSKWLN